MSHNISIEGLNPKELAKAISELRYDAMRDFLKQLRLEIQQDVVEDTAGGRTLLASYLSNLAGFLSGAESATDYAWKVCQKHEEKKED